jgi:hypothetical protein
MATRRGGRGGVTVRAVALLLGACLAAPVFASTPGDHPQRALAPEPESASAGAPILVSDPGTGATVIIWSRSDGGTAKLAWARRDESGWSQAHDLTFGPGLDLSPAVGVSRTGTWLFWRGEKGQIFSAPIDLSRGHLLAVPRTLARGSGGTPTGNTGVIGGGLVGGLGGGSIRPEGGQDVPIIVRACDPSNPVQPCVSGGDSGPGTRDLPPQITPEGGQDVPIIPVGGTAPPTSSGTNSGDLGVSSDPECDAQVVTLVEGRSILMIQFTGSGEIAGRMRLRAAPGVDPSGAAAAAGDYFLKTACH